ncbi:MAG: hypothetical protein J5I94_20145, partial [Phaeodactylibacter sp.]|nr:hypothetical protein [Phaeodactylibacter sp.]
FAQVGEDLAEVHLFFAPNLGKNPAIHYQNHIRAAFLASCPINQRLAAIMAAKAATAAIALSFQVSFWPLVLIDNQSLMTYET